MPGSCSSAFPIRSVTAWPSCATAASSASKKPKSDYAVSGIYLYPPDVFDFIKTLKPSARGELEITDVNRHYLENNRLSYRELPGYWTDAGTLESLATANQLVAKEMPSY